MSRWIVDGMNVIGSRPDGWWRDRTGAMAALVAALDAFAAAAGDPVCVVLDGRARDVGLAERVEVVWADQGGRDAADAVIAARVAADPAPREIVVVTSDVALAEQVAAAGASVERAGAFRARLP